MTVQEMKASYKFVLYLISLACVWWLMNDMGAGLTCMSLMFVSGFWCIFEIRIELLARFCCCLCAFFWCGILSLTDDALGNWFAGGLVFSFFLNFLASVRSWYEPGCVPMDDC